MLKALLLLEKGDKEQAKRLLVFAGKRWKIRNGLFSNVPKGEKSADLFGYFHETEASVINNPELRNLISLFPEKRAC